MKKVSPVIFIFFRGKYVTNNSNSITCRIFQNNVEFQTVIKILKFDFFLTSAGKKYSTVNKTHFRICKEKKNINLLEKYSELSRNNFFLKRAWHVEYHLNEVWRFPGVQARDDLTAKNPFGASQPLKSLTGTVNFDYPWQLAKFSSPRNGRRSIFLSTFTICPPLRVIDPRTRRGSSGLTAETLGVPLKTAMKIPQPSPHVTFTSFTSDIAS